MTTIPSLGDTKMMKNHVMGLFAAPVVAAAIFGGAALALAGSANADYSYSDYSASTGGGWGYPESQGDIAGAPMFASPTTYADPAPEVVPWAAWINQIG